VGEDEKHPGCAHVSRIVPLRDASQTGAFLTTKAVKTATIRDIDNITYSEFVLFSYNRRDEIYSCNIQTSG
jgi:hypothetical protein